MRRCITKHSEHFKTQKCYKIEKSREKEISKKLSYFLRHSPESLPIELDEGGWADVESLIEKMQITIEDLVYVVQQNVKQRFSLSQENHKIRANQGHSIKVDLQLHVQSPPNQLFHGTSKKNLNSIMTKGILKMNRNHVHLSADIKTAREVGTRHGSPLVLSIDCEAMIEDKLKFFKSENGVWLTEYIDPKYIGRI